METVSEPVVVHIPWGDVDEALARTVRLFIAEVGIAEVCEPSEEVPQGG
jgi:hypothetical protein